MSNMNRENNISQQPIDLNQIYGIDEIVRSPQSNVEDLAGYNLMSSNWNTSNNENTQQNSMPNTANNTNANSLHTTPAAPQRQEQTFPSSRAPMDKMQPPVNSTDRNNAITEKNLKSFLQNQIGQMVKMQFLIGTNTLVEQKGTIVGVGDNYIILKDLNTGELLVCNFNDVKFIKLINQQ